MKMLNKQINNSRLTKILVLVCLFATSIICAQSNSNIGIKIQTPKNWEKTKPLVENQTVLQSKMEHIIDDQTRYTANITSQRVEKIIDTTKTHGLDKLVQNYVALQKKNMYVTSYKLGSQEKIDLENVKNAVIYYSYFSLSGIKLMQVNLIIPAKDHHFFTSYTDLVENIEGKSSSYYNELIWPSLYSIKVRQPQIPPKPSWHKFGLILIGCCFALIIFLANRSSQNREIAQNVFYAELDDEEQSIKDTKKELQNIIENPSQSAHNEPYEAFEEDEDFFDDDIPLAS